MKKVFLSSIAVLSLFANEYYYRDGKAVELKELKSLRNTDVRYFVDTTTEQTLGVTTKILVAFKSGVDLQQIYTKYNLKELQKFDTSILLEVINGDSIAISNALVESGVAIFAHPNFLKDIKTKALPSDEFFAKQWHLADTSTISGGSVNITDAWKITKGKGIKIAVFDDAVDTNHEDLKDAVVGRYNSKDKSEDTLASKSDDAHGTYVAGIAVARENGKGVVGVAPEASLLAMKGATGEGIEDSMTIASFEWAKKNGADVMNNSWGSYGVSDGLKAAIVDLAKNGRNGKGTIIAFGAGNEGCNDTEQCMKDGKPQGTLDKDESSIEEVLSVGATNHLNARASYSNYGKYLDITAPGGDGDEITSEPKVGMVSTDLTGSDGYSKETNNNYVVEDPNQVGTSYASPVVAGVSALILGANSDLTREQVFQIIYETADKSGGYTYTSGKSYELGYGKINAKKAVEKALSMKSGSSESNTTTISTTSESNTTKPTTDSNITSDTSIYKFDTLGAGWHLLGAISNLGDIKSANSLQVVWSYSNETWSQNPTTIEAGKGFWIKK